MFHNSCLTRNKARLNLIKKARFREDRVKLLKQDRLDKRFASLAKAAELAPKGDWAEFGVYKGRSARFLLNLLPSEGKFHLFDSFAGLPYDWSGVEGRPAGHFSLKNIPFFNDNRVKLHVGWFKDTIQLIETKGVSLVHVDCDIYESTVDVLNCTTEFLVPGSVVVFDEFYNYPSWKWHEAKAFMEWTRKKNVEFEWLWRTSDKQVAVKILNLQKSNS